MAQTLRRLNQLNLPAGRLTTARDWKSKELLDLFMNKITVATPKITLIKQALSAAQHSTKQVALLVVGFDHVEETAPAANSLGSSFIEEMELRLRAFLRESDIVIQVEDGKLAVLLLSISGSDDAVLLAIKIVKTLKGTVEKGQQTLEICPRVGIALIPEHTTHAESLIERANIALGMANQTQQSYFVFAHDPPPKHAPLGMRELRHAIVADQLFLLFQPKIDLSRNVISGLEVLSRWQHPDLGVVSPNEFIPVAERTGLIIPLTLWVLHEAVLQCHDWSLSGIETTVAVNLSMWNLEEPEFPHQIEGLLKSIGMPADKLELEITESAIMADPRQVMQTLQAIKELGVHFTIDDFGTGYSSLAYLRKLPVSGIKIDKSFVQNMEFDRDNAVIVRSIVELGHNLGLNVIAEGVETAEANEMLKTFQCDEAQGFYYSRPIPSYAIRELLVQPGNIIKDSALFERALAKPSTHKLNGTHGRRGPFE